MPSLQQLHTFQLASQCQRIVSFDSVDSLKHAYQPDVSSWFLGEGSNTVFIEDFDGVVYLNQIKGIRVEEKDDSYYLYVGAGENWHQFVTTCLQNGWHGLENLALIPGTVGAAPIQNIGAYGVEVKSYIKEVISYSVTKGQITHWTNADCEFGYRDSVFKRKHLNQEIICEVVFQLPKVNQVVASYGELAQLDNPTPEQVYHTVIDIRQRKLPDPQVMGNAGSFFKNPVVDSQLAEQLMAQYSTMPHFRQPEGTKIPAAWLIDQAGFKGHVVGGVICHKNQPLVLANYNNAVGADLVAMAKQIMQVVHDKFGVRLEPEARLVGTEGLIEI